MAYTVAVRVTWDRAKNLANQKRHGISFQEASELFRSGVDYLEQFDDDHSDVEDRFIAIGPIRRGLVMVVWTERDGDVVRIISARWATRNADPFPFLHHEADVTDMPELTRRDFARAIPASVRRRLMRGQFESGDDIAALRRFVGLTQARFARAMGISVHTLRNWEQDRRSPEGPALALLRIAARHPRILLENLKTAA